MMVSPKESQGAAPAKLRDALESLHACELTGPLDELADVLVTISGSLGRLHRALGSGANGAEHQGELTVIDRAFSRSIALTRTIRERLQARRLRGEYASASHVVREVVGTLQTVVPDHLFLSLQCPPGPAIVAADRGELRRLVAALVESGIEACRDGGKIALEVLEVGARSSPDRQRSVHIHLRCTSAIRSDRVAAAQSIVRGLGGTLALREALRGGTLISVALACGF
jgi:Arc/MetJ-type ribon-helix-helix transcriptional regulator